MEDNIQLSRTQQVYLETVDALVHTHGHAHVAAISRKTHVSMASVTEAMRSLEQKKLVHYEKRKYITLTARAATVVRELKKRRVVLMQFLEQTLNYSNEKSKSITDDLVFYVDDDFCSRLNDCTRRQIEQNRT